MTQAFQMDTSQPLVKVTSARALDGYRLTLTFSDGSRGTEDLTDYIAVGGPMVEPLADPAYFARVFLSFGVPTWPNGFDLDAIALRDRLEAAGKLSRPVAAE